MEVTPFQTTSTGTRRVRASLQKLILFVSHEAIIAGRGIPDVAALGTNFQVIVQNYTGPISGTSAASPTFAAIVSLVNDQRYLMVLSLILPSRSFYLKVAHLSLFFFLRARAHWDS